MLTHDTFIACIRGFCCRQLSVCLSVWVIHDFWPVIRCIPETVHNSAIVIVWRNMELYLSQRIPPLPITLSDCSLHFPCLPLLSFAFPCLSIVRNYVYDKRFSDLIPGLERLYPFAYLNSVFSRPFYPSDSFLASSIF